MRRRYQLRSDLVGRLRQALAGLRGDYGSARLPLVALALFYVGARRLEPRRYLGGDPMVARFCGLACLPARRTAANSLRQFTQETLAPLVALNRDLVTDGLGRLELPRLYSAVATNLPLGLPALWAFIGGRGAQESTIAELKGEFALDVVSSKHYTANSAWEQLSILAYNLIRSFQLEILPNRS